MCYKNGIFIFFYVNFVVVREKKWILILNIFIGLLIMKISYLKLFF